MYNRQSTWLMRKSFVSWFYRINHVDCRLYISRLLFIYVIYLWSINYTYLFSLYVRKWEREWETECERVKEWGSETVSDKMREWKSEKVREWESDRVKEWESDSGEFRRLETLMHEFRRKLNKRKKTDNFRQFIAANKNVNTFKENKKKAWRVCYGN